MGTLLQDTRYGFRMLRKRPGFTAIAILALALGIGANTAIFSVVNAVLLRPLPFAGAERLATVEVRSERTGAVGADHSYPNLVDLREQAGTLEHLAAYSMTTAFLAAGDEPERVRGLLTTADLFPALGVQPLHGRVFTREEDQKGATRVVVLSHGLWQRRFGGDPAIVGKEIPLGGIRSTPTLVLGVMPEGFKFPVGVANVDYWMPLVPILSDSDLSRASVWLTGLAKLKEGASEEQARSELQTISRRLEEQYKDSNADATFMLRSYHEQLVGDMKTALLVLLGAVGCVLLIACANVANLMLARAAARGREISIRTALGASRAQIVRQLLTESVLLSILGGALGLLIAWWGVDVLVAAVPSDLPRAAEVALDARVLLFTAALSILTGLIFGLAPALQASRADVSESLKEGGRGSVEGGRSPLRSVLVVAEVAVSLVLLVGAGLLAQSFARLMDVSPGFDAERVLAFDVVFRGENYTQRAATVPALEELLTQAAAVPGVEAVGVVNPLPLGGNFEANSFQIEGRAPAEPGREPSADRRVITSDYFRAMGIHTEGGRVFDSRDAAAATPVAIINQTFARQHFPGENPIGRRLLFTNTQNVTTAREIVGLVADVRHAGLDAESGPEFYVPFAQAPAARVTVVARTTSDDPAQLAPALRGAVRQVDKNFPVYNVRTMESYLAESVARRRFNMTLLGGFALVALLLAGLGIYGVMSYTVAQRTHEIGVRMALGAQARDVLRLVIRQGMAPALAGVGVGLVCALALTRVMSSLLFGVTATDPLTFAGVALLLSVVALVSCYLPARRATKVDPMVALRYE
ncbi:MAG TPA: ABC transporter permease [Pyrinomonadaceae bacterium]